jgi:aminomethyltransferase
MTPNADSGDRLDQLPLDAWHRAAGGRMVPFAGYFMPLQYTGIVSEHEWTRSSASLFDVSHMGQLLVEGERAAEALEALLPTDVAGIPVGRTRYSLLLDDSGGIRDDLMITRMADGPHGPRFYLVVNGATKHDDIAWMRGRLPSTVVFSHLEDRALIALQGPRAAEVIEGLVPGISGEIAFMQTAIRDWNGQDLWIARSGYTGEDGFEISLPASDALSFVETLTADERVRPAGLGARDSLRLEAGLPLYGHDIDLSTDPVSAGLGFALSRKRREQGGFPGATAISRIRTEGPTQKRVGVEVEGRLPAREGARVLFEGKEVGRVTSGGFSPTLGQPIAMALVAAEHAEPGTPLSLEVRGRELAAVVTPLPFVPHRYHRSGAPA